MSSNIDIISADISIFMISSFWWYQMENQKIFWTGNKVILWHHSLCCDAIIEPSFQRFSNAVNIKVGIYITM